jgi:hypothetical protein
MIMNKFVSLILFSLFFSCTKNEPIESIHQEPLYFARSDIPIKIGSYWKYKFDCSDDIDISSRITTVKIERAEKIGIDTVRIYYKQSFQDTASNKDVVLDSAVGILTNSSYTYRSLRDLSWYELRNDEGFGNYHIELPIKVNKRWVSENLLDTLCAMYSVIKYLLNSLEFSTTFNIHSFYEERLKQYSRHQEITLSKGVGVISKGFYGKGYPTHNLYDIGHRYRYYSLIEYHIEK